jgi:hypothetical protein
MYCYLDFHTGPDDRVVRFMYQVQFRRANGWIVANEIARQLENEEPLFFPEPKSVKLRSGRLAAGEAESYRMPGGAFGNPGWWFDLSASPEFPTLELVAP